MAVPLWADFRSDACTVPNAAMRRAMAEAEVGNEDFHEDPTIRRCEHEIAAMLGKPAALFVQSGTMGNLVALMSHLERGGSVLTSPNSHIAYWEGDAVRRVVGADFEFVSDKTAGPWTTIEDWPTERGTIRLLCLETPVNRLGGTLLPLEHLGALRERAAAWKIPVHLDGARLFNASCAMGIEPALVADCCDSVTVSFNKAVGAPAGAALVGSQDLIDRARRFRWMLGGAWKQGGVLAAACLVGLLSLPERIAADHRLARELAEGLRAISGVSVDLDRVVTNLVLVQVVDPAVDLPSLQQGLREHGVAIGRFKEHGIARLVTHQDIRRDSLPRFLELFERLLQASKRPFQGATS
jgi:threonine aldolase